MKLLRFVTLNIGDEVLFGDGQLNGRKLLKNTRYGIVSRWPNAETAAVEIYLLGPPQRYKQALEIVRAENIAKRTGRRFVLVKREPTFIKWQLNYDSPRGFQYKTLRGWFEVNGWRQPQWFSEY